MSRKRVFRFTRSAQSSINVSLFRSRLGDLVARNRQAVSIGETFSHCQEQSATRFTTSTSHYAIRSTNSRHLAHKTHAHPRVFRKSGAHTLEEGSPSNGRREYVSSSPKLEPRRIRIHMYGHGSVRVRCYWRRTGYRC